MENTKGRESSFAEFLRSPFMQIAIFFILPFAVKTAYPKSAGVAVVSLIATAISLLMFGVNENSKWRYLWVAALMGYVCLTMVTGLVAFGANPLS